GALDIRNRGVSGHTVHELDAAEDLTTKQLALLGGAIAVRIFVAVIRDGVFGIQHVDVTIDHLAEVVDHARGNFEDAIVNFFFARLDNAQCAVGRNVQAEGLFLLGEVFHLLLDPDAPAALLSVAALLLAQCKNRLAAFAGADVNVRDPGVDHILATLVGARTHIEAELEGAVAVGTGDVGRITRGSSDDLDGFLDDVASQLIQLFQNSRHVGTRNYVQCFDGLGQLYHRAFGNRGERCAALDQFGEYVLGYRRDIHL